MFRSDIIIGDLLTSGDQPRNDLHVPTTMKKTRRSSSARHQHTDQDQRDNIGKAKQDQRVDQEKYDENMKDFESDDDDMEPKEAMELFAERVTISGLKEAYKAKIKGVRIMFRIALIFCSIMITYKTYDIAMRYKYQGKVFVDLELINYRAPFPNVSICLPPFINNTMVEQWALPKRVTTLKKKLNMTTNDIIGVLGNVLLWGFYDANMGQYDRMLKHMVTRKAFREAAEDAKKHNKSVWEFLWPSCSETLSNCAFDGQPFDCCQAATIIPLLTTPCIQIRSDRIPVTSKGDTFDPLRLEATGLTFDVSTNWALSVTSSEGDIGDGYHIFIDELPDSFKVPVNVPARMDVLLNLAQPKKVSERTDCVPTEKIPKLKYFPDYDSNGVQCQMEAVIDLGLNQLGCLFPMLSFLPLNGSCLFEAWYIASLLLDSGAAAFQSMLPTANSSAQGDSKKVGTAVTMNTKESETFDTTRGFLSKDSPCKPLCSRWTYPVLSASYGSIQYRDKNLGHQHWSNRSWSRVRVVIPQSSSSHKEEPRLSSYLAFCDIKGMMSIYAGFSVVTYAQILGYGLYLLWCLGRQWNNKPKIRKELLAIVIPSVETTFIRQLHIETLSGIEIKRNATIDADASDAPDSIQHPSHVLETEL